MAKNIKVFASIFCLMGLSPRLLANEGSAPNRWESIRDKEHIIIKPIFEYKSFELDITSKNGRSLTWEPNTSISLGSDFYFKDYPGIGASYTLAGQDEKKYGATRNYDLRFSYDFKQRYFYQLDLQHYKSFYAKDPTLIPNPVVDSALSLNNLSFRGIYVLSPKKFSIEALRSQTIRQIESGGSLLLGAYVGYAEAASPNGLIPVGLRSAFGEEASLKKVSMFSLTSRIGYGYTWVPYNKFFLGAYGLLGLGAIQSHLNYGSVHSERNRLEFAIDANLFTALGYTGDTFSSSISFDSQGLSLSNSRSALTFNHIATALNFGWRF